MININYRNILIKFVLWLFIGFLITIVGISNVFAEQINVGYITNKTDFLLDVGGGAPVSLPANTTNSYGLINQVWVNINNIDINKDYVYQVEISTPYATFTNVNTMNIVANGNQICTAIGFTDASIGFPKIYFQCLSSFTSGTLMINLYDNSGSLNGIVSNSSTFRWNYTYLRYFDDDDDIDLIVSNATQNTNNIINNNNTNTQNIINNQNQNTQAIINSNIICSTIDKDSIVTDNYFLSSSGSESSNSSYGITDYISTKDATFTPISTGYRNYCTYSSNKTLINCYDSSTLVPNTDLTFGNNVSYVRFSIFKSTNIPTINRCIKSGASITNSIDDLNDSLNNSNIDDSGIASAFEDFDDFLDDNSTITQLITLPITLYTAILNNVNGTCQPFNLGELYGEDLILPCINVSQYLGSSLWTMIDIIISGFAVYSISKKMIKVFNNFSSLREGDVIDD